MRFQASKQQRIHFDNQLKVTLIELESNQIGNRGDQKHPFDIQQLEQLLLLNDMKKFPEEIKLLIDLKRDMTTLNNGGRVQCCVPSDIRWERLNQAIEIIKKLLKR